MYQVKTKRRPKFELDVTILFIIFGSLAVMSTMFFMALSLLLFY